MAVNLIRNSRVFFTTNVDSYGRVKIGDQKGSSQFTTTNTWEIQVLEGLTFSQNTTQDTVTLNEAGAAPSRGQRSFNTALQPVDFSFSTYVRPYNDTTNSKITAEERVLWNAFGGVKDLTQATAAWKETSSAATMSFANSNVHQLQTFGLIIIFDNTAYALDNCALDTATLDFGIDAIAAVQWAGKASNIRPLTDLKADNGTTTVTFSGLDVANATEYVDATFSSLASNATITFTTGAGGTDTFAFTNTSGATLSAYDVAAAFAGIALGGSGTSSNGTYGTNGLSNYYTLAADGAVVRFVASGTGDVTPNLSVSSGATLVNTAGGSEVADVAKAKNVTARYITNKLSTLVLNDGINDFINTGTPGTTYSVALTGGQITFNNNLTYLTPANLATVNLPITYFTGTRAITGNVTAYLKTGTNETAKLLKDMLLAASTTVDPKYTINVQLGGPSTNLTGVEIKLPAAMLQIPQINTAQVISTTINFTAQGYSGSTYDITAQNEASIVYRAAA